MNISRAKKYLVWPAVILSVGALLVLLVWRTDLKPTAPAQAVDIDHHLELSVGKDGRFLVVPIELNGQELGFLVDTGAAITIFDESLESLLGEPAEAIEIQTPAGISSLRRFGCPDARLGSYRLDVVGSAASADLQQIRASTG